MPAAYLVVMAGGAGTRFWPASRNLRPKQLLPLGASAEESLLAATVRRLEPLFPAERVYIATGAHLRDATLRELPRVPQGNILAEPVARNTAPCIGWAAATLAARDPDALVAVLPSDHYITNDAAFREVCARALAGAEAGFITTIGVVPTRAETGYGYIEVGAEQAPGRHAVVRFVEKPDRATAEAFVAGRKHWWNAGMFFFRARTMLDAIAEHLPKLAEGLRAIASGGDVASIFPTLPSISIDHGVMQPASTKTGNLAVVPGEFGWNDVGSWATAWELATKDARGNAMPEGAIGVDARNNLVRDLTTDGKKRVYALVGVNDLVVVETDDAVLVIPRDRAQDVREIVEALKKSGRTELL